MSEAWDLGTVDSSSSGLDSWSAHRSEWQLSQQHYW
jgi:hypothetical protein